MLSRDGILEVPYTYEFAGVKELHLMHEPIGETEWEMWGLAIQAEIVAMRTGAEYCFLEIGRLIHHVREFLIWDIMHYESLKDFILDCEFPVETSYSWATRMAGIYEHIALKSGLTNKELAMIGVSKLSRLLPLARDGILSPELLKLAMNNAISDKQLKEYIKPIEGGDGDTPPSCISCPRCGADIMGAKWE